MCDHFKSGFRIFCIRDIGFYNQIHYIENQIQIS